MIMLIKFQFKIITLDITINVSVYEDDDDVDDDEDDEDVGYVQEPTHTMQYKRFRINNVLLYVFALYNKPNIYCHRHANTRRSGGTHMHTRTQGDIKQLHDAGCRTVGFSVCVPVEGEYHSRWRENITPGRWRISPPVEGEYHPQ